MSSRSIPLRLGQFRSNTDWLLSILNTHAVNKFHVFTLGSHANKGTTIVTLVTVPMVALLKKLGVYFLNSFISIF